MMKRMIFVLMIGLLSAWSQQALAQSQDLFGGVFRDKSNLCLFSGFVDRQDSKNYGYYYGVYADYRVLKSLDGAWTIAPYLVLSRSNSESPLDTKRNKNNSGYNNNSEYGGGLSFGFYEPDFTFRHQLFVGASLGLRYGQEEQYEKQQSGIYSGWQNDLFLSAGLNLHLLKSFGLRPDLFPRSQIQATIKVPIKSEKEAYWNDKKIEGINPWNKSYFEVLGKTSVFQSYLSYRSEIQYAPKIIALYSYSAGDSRSFYGLGAEISLRREYRDNFLSLNVLYKESRAFADNYLIVGLNFNLSSLLKK